MLDAFLADIGLMIVTTGGLVGTAATLVGVFLVLRRNSMLSDAISHAIVLGIVVVWLLTGQQSGPLQILGAALAGVLTVALTELLVSTRKVKDDAAIGLVFPVLFAIGVLLLNLYARDVHIDEHTVLLGEIGFVWLKTITLGGHEVPQSLVAMGAATLVNALFVGLLYKELKLATFDPALARALGFAPGVLFYALLLLTSTTAVAAFEAVGAVLFIAFVIVPPATAYLLTDRLGFMIGIGVVVSWLSSVLGYLAAVALDVSIGGMMALVTGAFLTLAFLFGPRYGLVARTWRRSRQRYADETRTLAVHLYTHEAAAERDEETAVANLHEHLRWPAAKVRRVAARGARLGYLVRDGARLRLTPKGRDAVRDLLEPWAAGG